MPTDERPPPEPWYKKLVPTALKSVWETVKTDWREAGEEAERQDPWHVQTNREQARIAWEALRGRIPHEEAMLLYREAGQRREKLSSQLRGHPSAEDGPANG